MIPPGQAAFPSTPAPAESESPMTSMRLFGAAAGTKSEPPVPKLESPVSWVTPMLGSVFRQITRSCGPFVNPVASDSDVCPAGLVMVVGVPPSITTVNRFLLLPSFRSIEACVPVNRALRFTPGHEKRTDPAVVPGAVRPMMRRPSAPASPTGGLAAASRICVPGFPSEPELAPEVAPELPLNPEAPPAEDPELAPDPDDPPTEDAELDPAEAPELDPAGAPELDPELAPEGPGDIAPELLDEPIFTPPFAATPEGSAGEAQALAIDAAAPNATHPVVLE